MHVSHDSIAESIVEPGEGGPAEREEGYPTELDTDTFIGEVFFVAEICAWLTPIGPLPSEVDAALVKQAERIEFTGDAAMRRFFGGAVRIFYVHMTNIAETNLVLVKGMKVRFEVYQDENGVEGRAVTSV